ncbi:MAG: lasso peptide isopeptide bond-forming cyclase [Cyanomargarita calcarea GSE-NOS-MK-12-04C]|jgi:asparagine synthase (glutamine-hydrolysing)|uniref:asparagine synthase (glutamine-hydrolyzing) n=1 Tax=Cyanomargarita calcarea GSE-NOS-MK-12-04C TaxID=2839659 RepID=A0A951QM54_9CYAN|nr:lasso peptide isopeptide bond-forming cyclase [Cyanomargarita calcarea GSE-NOS-MK-12-04C]
MSAIVGIHYLDGRPVEQELGRMVDILAHRGPDGADIWIDGPVGFGHRMLWTTPESLLEKLPLVSQSGDVVITADCRIDNREELISAFQLEKCPPEKITDSQLILAAYEKWGQQCPEHLLGDFAFAIWDKREQTLFCARDHFGVKPFYYYSSGQTFAFATEIKGLLCLPEVPRQLNEKKIADHFGLGGLDTTITFYQHILRLPAAHIMKVSCQGVQLQSYWSLDPNRELRLGSDEEYAAKFREIFTEAVRCRLRSAFPVGSMLSGGLDSSSITCVAQELYSNNENSKLHTFSAIHEQITECDERFYQNAVLAKGGLESHQLNTDALSPLSDLDRVLWHQDEVQSLANFYANWFLYDSASSHGVRVILDGFDGDNTVSHGTGYLTELAEAGHWLTLASEVRAFSKNLNQPWIPPLLAWMRVYGLNPLISKFFILRVLGSLRRLMRYSKRGAKPSELSNILSRDFIQRYESSNDSTKRKRPKTERESQYRRLTDPGEQNTLEKLNSAAAAFCIEPRFPFWDKRLIEFCLSLPPEQKLNRGWGRMVMRRAMEGIMPKEIQWRPGKTDHSQSFNHGLLTFERECLDDVILKHPEVIESYVNLSVLQEAYQRFLTGKATGDEAVTIWNILSLALWLRKTELSKK